MKNFLILGVIPLLVALVVGAIIFIGAPDNAKEAEKQTTTEPELMHVHGFAVDVANPERLLIATHHGLMQLESDVLSKVGTASDDFMGFTPHPTDPSIFYSSGHSMRGGNLGFQKSIDGGRTWQRVSEGLHGPVDFHSMTVSQVNSDLVYGYFGGIQRSKDGGMTWEVAKGQIQPYSLSTDPKKEDVVYAATANGVMVSEDWGDTWRGYSSGLENGAVSVFAIDPEGTYALTFSQVLGGMGKTNNNGVTWTKITESFGDQPVMFIAYSKNQTGTIYTLTQSNSIYKSTDEGLTWTKLR